ncbi:MAG: hypothetical protein JW816_02260 [Candidatus Buchananbacteria bacterium]|nr:hypothetical protein [Candidatus Buchananbacteria bacterium]
MKNYVVLSVVLLVMVTLGGCATQQEVTGPRPVLYNALTGEPVSAYSEAKPSIVVDGYEFALEPPTLTLTVKKGQEAPIRFFIRSQCPLYAFGVFGYGEGVPSYTTLMDAVSGGGRDTIELTGRVSTKYLETGTYQYLLPVEIEQVIDGTGEKGVLRLEIKVTVTP